jgi:hypothetical protein
MVSESLEEDGVFVSLKFEEWVVGENKDHDLSFWLPL